MSQATGRTSNLSTEQKRLLAARLLRERERRQAAKLLACIAGSRRKPEQTPDAVAVSFGDASLSTTGS